MDVLLKLSEEQLKQNITIKDDNNEEYFGCIITKKEEEEDDVLDKGHVYFTIKT